MNRSNRKSIDVRQLIVRDRRNSRIQRKFKKYEISMGAKKIWDKYNKYGTVNDLVKCGRPRKTSMRVDRKIIRQVKKDFVTARAIKKI